MVSFFPLAYGQVTYRRIKRGNVVVEEKRLPHLQTRFLFQRPVKPRYLVSSKSRSLSDIFTSTLIVACHDYVFTSCCCAAIFCMQSCLGCIGFVCDETRTNFWFTLEIKTSEKFAVSNRSKAWGSSQAKQRAKLANSVWPHFDNLQHYNPIAWAS